MTDTYLHRDNHYVPRMYLKRFEATPGRVLTYRTLVAHVSVPVWKPQPVARVPDYRIVACKPGKTAVRLQDGPPLLHKYPDRLRERVANAE